jgi:hypothetical protein
VNFPDAGVFKLSATIAAISDGAEFVVEVGDQQVAGTAPNTGDWGTFQTIDLAQIDIKQAGDQVIKVRSKDATTWKAINLNCVTLTAVK